MKDETQKCRVCGESLNSPLGRARGAHDSCLEKAGGDGGEERIEK